MKYGYVGERKWRFRVIDAFVKWVGAFGVDLFIGETGVSCEDMIRSCYMGSVGMLCEYEWWKLL